jgi:hypothetical protein
VRTHEPDWIWLGPIDWDLPGNPGERAHIRFRGAVEVEEGRLRPSLNDATEVLDWEYLSGKKHDAKR